MLKAVSVPAYANISQRLISPTLGLELITNDSIELYMTIA